MRYLDSAASSTLLGSRSACLPVSIFDDATAVVGDAMPVRIAAECCLDCLSFDDDVVKRSSLVVWLAVLESDSVVTTLSASGLVCYRSNSPSWQRLLNWSPLSVLRSRLLREVSEIAISIWSGIRAALLCCCSLGWSLMACEGSCVLCCLVMTMLLLLLLTLMLCFLLMLMISTLRVGLACYGEREPRYLLNVTLYLFLISNILYV